jgi:8-oxo-dGTP pyrophosphatase MutT (NUDIX family)
MLMPDHQDDPSITAAALRETHEELGIPPENVEVLGMLDRPEYSLGNRARVWAVVVSQAMYHRFRAE